MSDTLECEFHFEPPPPMTVEFRSNGEVVGTLYMNEKPMRFEGDCDESAQVFWDSIIVSGENLKVENQRLRELVKSAFHEGCDSGHGGDFTWEESVSKKALQENSDE
jgi:hypothetical protein